MPKCNVAELDIVIPNSRYYLLSLGGMSSGAAAVPRPYIKY